ncbi:MAG: hypothetical protein DLM59_03680 [Pseudonocardiales bacterium]|nr:MAG: hypothetical protein DLM59_03680 [Pseudonocardiales bacterium]
MCDDHSMVLDDDRPERPALPAGQVSRRRLLQAGLGAAAGGLLLPAGLTKLPAAVSTASGIDDTTAVSMAMHVHTSFSEQSGSVEAHLAQAAQNSVDVMWLTDHDHRMLQLDYRQVVHFTSLTAEDSDGPAWSWERRDAGPLTASSSGGIASQASPDDPIPTGSLQVSAQSQSTAVASLGFFANSVAAGLNYHGNLFGQKLTIDVLPSSIGPDGYLELLVDTSFHPAVAGRPAGRYSLSYRFGGAAGAGRQVANGIAGIVHVAVAPGRWNTVTVTPTDDIAALWPDMAEKDFASFGLTLSAVSTGGVASGLFDYLRFSRTHNTGNVPLRTQADLMDGYRAAYRAVTAYQGLEISGFSPHVNWFGPGVQLGDYNTVTSDNYLEFLQGQIADIHSAGGVASYNHPFGTTPAPALPVPEQNALVSQVAATLLANDVLGCDVIEVGYPLRGQCDLDHHVALWDVLSRNGRFVTGNGANDDHFGEDWAGLNSNWYTSVWARDTDERHLVQALRSGRAWTASLSRFRGNLDLLVDGTAPMGSVSVSSVQQRQVEVAATGLPQGGIVEVVRGACDFTGTTASTTTVASFSAADLAGGSVSLGVDTSSSCFVRTQVLDSGGQIVALSNPAWLLRANPPRGIPAARDWS